MFSVVDGGGEAGVGESLVEAVQRQQLLKRELKLRSSSGAEVPKDEGRCPTCRKRLSGGSCADCSRRLCICGCGRPVWPRSTLQLSRTCFVRVASAFRDCPEELRAQLRAYMPPDAK